MVFLSCGGTASPVFQPSLSSSFRSALARRPEKAPKNELVFVAGFDGSAKDVFASFALESHVLVAATSAMEVRRAMSLHRSQWVWYRKLFVVFSRYAYVNSLRRL